MRSWNHAFVLLLFLTSVGCSKQTQTAKAPPSPLISVQPDETVSISPPARTAQDDLKRREAEQLSAAQLNKFESEYYKAKDAYEKNSKSQTAKETYVMTTVRLGTATMVADSLDAKVKYRRALELYREALKLDPENKEAGNNKDMIERIYRQMGRPIPQ